MDIVTIAGIGKVSVEQLCSQDADGILYDLNRDEATTKTLMGKKGGLRKIRLVNDLAVAKVIRYLKRDVDWKHMSTGDLERLVERKTNELFRMRQEMDRRRGNDRKPNVNVDYEQYLTD